MFQYVIQPLLKWTIQIEEYFLCLQTIEDVLLFLLFVDHQIRSQKISRFHGSLNAFAPELALKGDSIYLGQK